MFGGLFKKKKKNNSSKNKCGIEGFAGGQVGNYLSKNYSQASDEAIEGMGLLRKEAERLLNVSDGIKQGNLFEIIEKTKFNVDAAVKESSVRAVTTAELGSPHAAPDILIRDGEKVLQEVQAKSSNSASRATFMISEEKYNGMQKLVNSDKADRVRELAIKRAETGTLKATEYIDTAENVTPELKYKNISSGGTSSDEALSATKDTDAYSNSFEIKQIKEELGVSVKQSAAAGAVIGGAISIVKNSVEVCRTDMSVQEAIENVAQDTTKAGVKSGAVGGLGSGIRAVAKKTGVDSLAKANTSTTVAAGIIDMGVTVLKYAKGEIMAEKAMEEMGQKGFSSMLSVYSGATAGLVFGPGGAVIGSIAGYMAASNVYQNCIEIFKYAELKEKEAQKVIALCEAACEVMRVQRKEFEQNIENRLNLNKDKFSKLFSIIEKGIKENDHNKCILAFSEFADFWGEELKLVKFEEFDDHMSTNNYLKL